jgi:parvulin-like peptidyl-prolyl isomerase
VTIRLIIVKDEAKADQVDAALAGGATFAETATRLSDMFADKGGLVLDKSSLDGPLSEFNLLFSIPLNEAVRQLKVGEHSGRVSIDAGHGWAMLQDLQGGEKRSLQDVYLELEERLRQQQFVTLTNRYYADLRNSGNFSDPNKMILDLTDVAMTRYGATR